MPAVKREQLYRGVVFIGFLRGCYDACLEIDVEPCLVACSVVVVGVFEDGTGGCSGLSFSFRTGDWTCGHWVHLAEAQVVLAEAGVEAADDEAVLIQLSDVCY